MNEKYLRKGQITLLMQQRDHALAALDRIAHGKSHLPQPLTYEMLQAIARVAVAEIKSATNAVPVSNFEVGQVHD